MIYVVVLCLCWCRLIGVFGQPVSITEGDSVTLNTDTEISDDDDILWKFAADTAFIARMKISRQMFSTFEGADGRFKDRLKLDRQTGSLTITNITTEHAGDYKLEISGKNLTPKTFTVSVYARLPVPVIINNASQCSSPSPQSNCSVVCSVVNVSAVSLSWYKGNCLLSSISVSDLSISLSLPLEVECQENNTYSCVINNTISNHTTHLDINTLCQPCAGPRDSPPGSQDSPPGPQDSTSLIVLISSAVGGILLIVVVAFCICRKCRKTVNAAQNQQENRSVSELCKQKARKMKSKKEPVYENFHKNR